MQIGSKGDWRRLSCQCYSFCHIVYASSGLSCCTQISQHITACSPLVRGTRSFVCFNHISPCKDTIGEAVPQPYKGYTFLQTKLIKEVQLPVTVETLWRGKVLPDGRRLEIGEGPVVPSLDLSALGTHSSDHTGSGIASEGSNAAKPPRENGGLGRRKSSKKLFKSLSNPFKDFIQPSQSGAELSSTQQLQVSGASC